MSLNRKRALLFASLFVGVGVIAFLIIRLAQGYKPDLSTGTLRPTGLLVATSDPDAAQLFVDGKLKSATNTTLSLAPDKYEVEIKKDGFFPWKKTLTLKKELVTKTDASLFSSFPDLKVLTFTGATDPLLSPDGQKVVFNVATASASKRGTWVLDLTDRPLGFNREPRQILESAPAGRDFSQASYEWSPDFKQILVTLNKETFLVDASRLNPTASLVNITQSAAVLKKRWEEEEMIKNEAKISKLPEKLLAALDEAIANLEFSPDETKILYTATAAATIPANIIPPLPAASTQPEMRTIEAGKQYVYDLKEDRNFLISVPAGSEGSQVSWFPTSRHLFVVQEDKISLVEYDNQNWMDIYTGPFENSFAFPFPSGTKLLILTSIGKNTPANLYAISLK
ncbi:hypothetical protein COT66_00570 [Candidatus Shapirobacteria bacterium CG09_land_8_20_14_0_10_49_15]|uniref:PEGA domain-containing protein n=2 Tax=Candidatus Shapironibacteriota TaxID=1752721 RepID=A0A2M8L6K2_9BACT|nr:MAG: hypothetical protein COT66_00570 [Candidatus Shapirobacteria bacterium CG09_land_8_20_14_0_10_49_15]PJE69852.1 MAG: hypothetical protein COU97_02870 [Candidatus Shapirobacteria bacterium CG10_big_fil_rev_8_21_14_0_10_48_15]